MTVYWRDRDGTGEVFGLPPWETFATLEEAERWLQHHPEATVLGAAPFFPHPPDPGEWGELTAGVWVAPRAILKGAFNAQGSYRASLISDGKTVWTRAFRRALSKIERREWQKVVLARRSSFAWEGNPGKLFRRVCQGESGTYRHYLQLSPERAFMSVTPECLFELRGRHLRLDALAGTRPRGADDQEDATLERELTTSDKELREHQFVVQALLTRLKDLGIAGKAGPRQVMKLSRVQHLHTQVSADLPPGGPSASVLCRALHPTPAVGGVPAAGALEFIASQEGFTRGLYAAPVGMLQRGRACFSVGLRSALVAGDRLHLYGGSGIVAGSREEEEWKETEDKMDPFLRVL